MKIKLKNIFLFFISIASFYCYSQVADTIRFDIDFKGYEAVIKNNIKARSVYTLKNKKAILDLYEKDSVKLLLDYKIDSEYIITSIPVFRFKDDFYNNHKSNVLHKIDFSNNFLNQFLNIYNNDEIVYKIQLGAFSKEKPANSFGDLPNVHFEKINNLYKYYSGSFTDEKSAKELIEKAKNSGYPGAFLVRFKNGQRL